MHGRTVSVHLMSKVCLTMEVEVEVEVEDVELMMVHVEMEMIVEDLR